MESIRSDLSRIEAESRRLAMSISQFDSFHEFVESANVNQSPPFLRTNGVVETMVIFGSAGFPSSEQIESNSLIRSNGWWMIDHFPLSG
jgi:hypothetical protein